MATILLYGDTVRSPALRHEVPLEIVDPFLYVARGGDAFVLTSALEAARIQAALPGAAVQLRDAFGWFELIEEGTPRDEADLEVAVRALRAWGIEEAVVPLRSGGGHDPGSGPLPAGLPITIDLWPRDDASGCWADMTRTFVNGEVTAEVAALRDVARSALEAARAAARPGVSGRALYDIAAEVVEQAGFPTQRTRRPGETLSHGFYFGLGHGVGLEIHEPPGLGLSGVETLLAGDVVAIEPGIEGIDGIGGVRFEDLLLITEDGCETLTEYPYELSGQP
jgi:Xaa-Pro aminopeptidase